MLPTGIRFPLASLQHNAPSSTQHRIPHIIVCSLIFTLSSHSNSLFSLSSVSSQEAPALSASDIEKYVQFYLTYNPSSSSEPFPAGSPTTTENHSSLAASSAISYADDPHAVSVEEARSWYAGLLSEPTLLYRTGDKWSPPQGREAQRRKKQLIPVFGGQLERAWNEDGLSGDVVKAMEDHAVLFTNLNIVRFRTVDEAASRDGEDDVSPLTVYVGVVPGSTAPTAAHNAAKDVKALLGKYNITDDVNIEFAEIH